jgi:iron complex outermembrane receptor protein
MSTVTRYPLLQTHMQHSRLTPLALALMLASTGVFAADNEGVEEIVVIGQGIGTLRLNAANGAGSRLGLSALDTPASVDLVTRTEIMAKGDYSAIDSITRTAGLSTTSNNGNGGMQVSSRGFNGHGTTINTYDGTRLYITAGTVTFPADTWTLDRVEVLRGAGSVINGVGALATTINYVPRKATLGTESFDSMAALGSFGLRRIAAGGNKAFNEQLAGRLDVALTEKDGYVDRADEERQVVATSLLWQPIDDFSMRFSVDYANIDAPPYWGTPLVNGSASDSLRQQNYNYADGKVNYKDVWARVHTEWQLSDTVTFRNDTFVINADREWQNLEEYAYDGKGRLDLGGYYGIVHDQQQVGTRGDLLFSNSIGNMDNRFTIGAEVNSVELSYLNNFNTGGFNVAESVPVFNAPLINRPAAVFTQLDYSTDTSQYGFFFDDVLELSDRFSVVLGGRYDDFGYDRVNHAQVTGRGRSQFDAGFSKFTWRAGLVFEASDTLSFYAQTSTAADPVTSPISINLANADFNLSEGRQYEVGMKQQFMSGKGEYTLAYFDIEKKGLVTRLPGTTISSQIGQQSSNGFEVTLRLNPLERLSIDMNAAFIDAEYDKFFVGGVSLAGNTPSEVPDTTANVWVNYAPIDKLQLGAGVRYVAERYRNVQNTGVLPSYSVVDAAASWLMDERTTLVLRARNLTDEKDYVLSEYSTDQWVFSEPRAYELSVRYSF